MHTLEALQKEKHMSNAIVSLGRGASSRKGQSLRKDINDLEAEEMR